MKNGKKSIFLIISTSIVLMIMLTACGGYSFLNKTIKSNVFKYQFAGDQSLKKENFFIETGCSLSNENDYLNDQVFMNQDATSKIQKAQVKGYGIKFVQINVNLAYFKDKQVFINYKEDQVEKEIKENSEEMQAAIDHMMLHLHGIENISSTNSFVFNFYYKDLKEEEYKQKIVESHIVFINKYILTLQEGYIFAYKIGYGINGTFETEDKEMMKKYRQIIDKQVENLPGGKIAIIDEKYYDDVPNGGAKNVVGKNFTQLSKKNNVVGGMKKKKIYEENRWNVNFAEIVPDNYSIKEALKIVETLYQKSVSYINYTKSEKALSTFEELNVTYEELRKKGLNIYNNWFVLNGTFVEKRSVADFIKSFTGEHYVISEVKVEKNSKSTNQKDYLTLMFAINNFGTSASLSLCSIYMFRGLEATSYQLADNPPYREGLWGEGIGAFQEKVCSYNIPKSEVAEGEKLLGDKEEIGIIFKDAKNKEINLYNNVNKKRYPHSIQGENFNKVLMITDMMQAK